jgi:hypothetical protein
VTGVLARTRLDEALAAGKKWKADAVLIQVGASGIGDDGTHPMWDYGFYSPASKACALINVAGGQSQVREAGSECEKNEIKDFMDSDKAIMVARTNGVTQPKVKMVVSTSPKGMKVAWNVMDGGGMKQGDVIIEFDAKSSELLSKMVQR